MIYFFEIRYFDDIETNRFQHETGIVYGDSINEAMDNLTLKYDEETIKEVKFTTIEGSYYGILTFDKNILNLLSDLLEEE